MKIAQVAPLYESVPPRWYGGTERVVSWLTEELVRLGHDVTLFASGDSVTNARLVAGCKKALRLENCADPLPYHMVMIEQVCNGERNFDLIHFHTDYLHFSVARREQVPCLTTLHGRLDLPDLPPLYKEFRELPLVSISDAQRGPLSWANWVGTVHHGLPAESLRPRDGTGNYLAFLGRISPEKGLDQAIEIARRSGMKLKVAAKIDRADRDYFEKEISHLLARPFIEFIGEIGNSEKEEFLGNAAALLFPIDWPEPFGLVMIESMACGTPVIAYRRGSVPEILYDGVSGFIVENIEEAVKAVGRIGEIDRQTCRRYFDRNFTAKRMAHDYLNLYKRLMERQSTAIAMEKGDSNWLKVDLPTATIT
jgi:glycosyltransferase involved in cell wall biosynthesis